MTLRSASGALLWLFLGAFALLGGPSAPPVALAQEKVSQVSPEQAKAIDAWTASLAVQAATYAAPLVAMYNLRDRVVFGENPKALPGQIWRLEDIATPKVAAESGYVSPNVDVLYGFGFADLSAEPVDPHRANSGGRYYMIEVVDMWTNAFAYPVGGASGYAGGKFAFVGPGWKGTLPPGVERIDAPTRWVEFQPRVGVKGAADLPAAREVLRGITLQGLAEYTGQSAPPLPAYHYEAPKMTPGIASSRMRFDDPLQFWSIFSNALNENPPPASEIDAVLPSFQYLGIEHGKQWKRENVPPAISRPDEDCRRQHWRPRPRHHATRRHSGQRLGDPAPQHRQHRHRLLLPGSTSPSSASPPTPQGKRSITPPFSTPTTSR